MTQNYTINNLPRRGSEKITAGVFDSFRVVVLANMLKRELFA